MCIQCCLKSLTGIDVKSLKNKKLIKKAIQSLNDLTPEELTKITHVCGTHEMTVSRFGIRSIIPKTIEVIPGPGCPVCVCPSYEIDLAIKLAKEGKIITTFGDMLKVPASKESLAEMKQEGEDIRVVYSPQDALKIARNNPQKEIVFLAIGFETSAPMTAAVLLDNPPENFSLISAHRLTVPAMELLLKEETRKTKGFICPGHVSTIIGLNPYYPFSEKYGMPCVISGFEAIDVLIGLVQIIKMIKQKKPSVINEYARAVKPEGNLKALKIIEEVYTVVDANWRGIGTISKSGLSLKKEFNAFDAEKKFDVHIDNSVDIHPGCRCHEVMLGNILPPECKLFLKNCTPEQPIGPCMVSHEGTCSIFARYGSKNFLRFE
ncbi:MAG: hydrogenase formation protein HypD [Candidatus Heimdallarchaeota archaeon]|nr:hydrogenase formation protein HypD [Candidatus Heimdallarchaeota archaeon]